jgi:putative PIN family toxin of toxin-antitoxin system
MRYILDTNILVAGLRSRIGASRLLLQWLYDGRYQALVSVAMMLEYEAVLTRPENLKAFHLAPRDIEQLLDSMAYLLIPVKTSYFWRPQLRDPADEHVLEAAVNGQADAIVTFNLRHFRVASSLFGIDVCRPGEALRRLTHDEIK